jgi:hypothetical protein
MYLKTSSLGHHEIMEGEIDLTSQPAFIQVSKNLKKQLLDAKQRSADGDPKARQVWLNANADFLNSSIRALEGDAAATARVEIYVATGLFDRIGP